MATSGSLTPTEPDVATWKYFAHSSDGDFARLIPLSTLAHQTFNRVIKRLLDDPSWMRHARRFIHYEPIENADRYDNDDDHEKDAG